MASTSKPIVTQRHEDVDTERILDEHKKTVNGIVDILPKDPVLLDDKIVTISKDGHMRHTRDVGHSEFKKFIGVHGGYQEGAAGPTLATDTVSMTANNQSWNIPLFLPVGSVITSWLARFRNTAGGGSRRVGLLLFDHTDGATPAFDLSHRVSNTVSADFDTETRTGLSLKVEEDASWYLHFRSSDTAGANDEFYGGWITYTREATY